jgi:uncharacterized RDD family membrane protein YckC
MAVKPSATTVTPPSPSLISGRGIVLANWGERFIAWLIDVLIIGVVSELLRLPGLSISMIPFTAFGYRDFILFLYWMLMEGTTGQSIGKMAMRLKVTRIDGSPANLAEAAIGSVGKAFLLPLDCIIGWIAESCKENRQRLFTMLAKTIVIKVTR